MNYNNNTNNSQDQNFSIPMTPIVDQNNFSNFFDSNDFLFSEQKIKEPQNQEQPQNKDENLSSLIIYCNQSLSNYGFSSIGNLEGPFNEINKTVMVIYELLQQRQRDLEFRNDVIEKIAKLESDKNSIAQNVVRLKTEVETLKKENGVLQNVNKSLEKKFKLDKDKLIYEKDEISKQLSKLNFKETQMLHELRKKEKEALKYKDQIKKTFLDKNCKNHLEIINNFPSNINNTASKAPEQIFLQEIKGIQEDVRQKLLLENQELRNMFIFLQNKMEKIIEEKKEIFMKKLINETHFSENLMDVLEKYFSDINIIRAKSEIFALPYDKIYNEVMSLFTKNFSIFENFFQKVVDFNFFQYYFKEVKNQLAEIHPNLGHSSSLKEFKTVLTNIKHNGPLIQSSSSKNLRNEENKENITNNNNHVKNKDKSLIMINANKEITPNNLNDISMSHFSKPFPKNNQSFSAGLKKKWPSLHQNFSYKNSEMENGNEKNEENDDMTNEIKRWEDCLNNKYDLN